MQLRSMLCRCPSLVAIQWVMLIMLFNWWVMSFNLHNDSLCNQFIYERGIDVYTINPYHYYDY